MISIPGNVRLVQASLEMREKTRKLRQGGCERSISTFLIQRHLPEHERLGPTLSTNSLKNTEKQGGGFSPHMLSIWLSALVAEKGRSPE